MSAIAAKSFLGTALPARARVARAAPAAPRALFSKKAAAPAKAAKVRGVVMGCTPGRVEGGGSAGGAVRPPSPPPPPSAAGPRTRGPARRAGRRPTRTAAPMGVRSCVTDFGWSAGVGRRRAGAAAPPDLGRERHAALPVLARPAPALGPPPFPRARRTQCAAPARGRERGRGAPAGR